MDTLKIIYEDNHIISAIKPFMVPTQSDISGDIDFHSMLKEYIAKKYNKQGNVYLGLLHRLDRPAGGVMLFARTSKAASRISAQFREGKVDKHYLAIVTGNPPDCGEFEDYLTKNEKTNTVSVSSQGKYARLSYKVLRRKKENALCEINLFTGRSHQIRVQFASRGYALLGDVRYGEGKGAHLALFSHRIIFSHPTLHQQTTLSAFPEHDEVFAEFF